jgi:protein tyrosine phosphatase (PTP) superfamily phosphohydrolase (DUF442 family)
MKRILLSLTLVIFTLPLQASIFKGGWNLLFGNNFHELQSGVAYRSGTMSPRKLAKKIRKHGIRTVINLRGAQPQKKWWLKQNALLKKMGIAFYNIPMNAKTLPSRRNIIELLDVFDHAQRPLLIHCQAGADRTSEAAALWKITQEGATPEEALKQLSPSFGHLRKRYPAKTFFIRLLPEKNVRAWIEQHYDPYAYPAMGAPVRTAAIDKQKG